MKTISINKSKDGEFFSVDSDLSRLWGNDKVTKQMLLDKGYLCNAFFYNIVNRVAEKSADLPTKFIDIQGNEIDTPETQALTQLVADAGGKYFVEENMANLIGLGECVIYLMDKPVGFNQADGLKTISPTSISPNTTHGNVNSEVENFTVSDFYVFDELGRERPQSTINADSIVWGRLPNIDPNTNRGLSPFEPNWDVVKATTNAFRAHGVLIGNMGANGLLASKGGENAFPLQSDERNILQKALDSLLGGYKSFMKTIITPASVEWIPIGVDPNKLEILKMQEQSLKVLCSAVNLDSKLFNDASASTFNNLSEANKTAYEDCYIPYTETFLSFLANKLLSEGIKWVVDREKLPVLNQRDQGKEKETREGITQVQKQVFEGIITLDAGVATLETVYDYDEEKATRLLGVPERVDINEDGATIEEGEKSQARFSEFGVGGVQGILAIQASVAQGITQYEAGISTLILIYGLSEEDSRTILGDKTELENALANQAVEQNNQF